MDFQVFSEIVNPLFGHFPKQKQSNFKCKRAAVFCLCFKLCGNAKNSEFNQVEEKALFGTA